MIDKKLDERPGPVPDIRADGDSVIYVIQIASGGSRLIIRCDPDGVVSASIVAPDD